MGYRNEFHFQKCLGKIKDIDAFALRFPRYTQISHSSIQVTGDLQTCKPKIVISTAIPYSNVAKNILCIFDMAVVSTIF